MIRPTIGIEMALEFSYLITAAHHHRIEFERRSAIN